MSTGVSIVGAASSRYGRVPDVTAAMLCQQAAARALSDAGMAPADVDGVFTIGADSAGMMPPVALCEYLGLRPRYLDGTRTGGSVWEFYVRHAVAALTSGMCSVALLVYGAATLSTFGRRLGTGGHREGESAGGLAQWEGPFGLPLVGRAALAASRHMYEYGTTSEQLAEVAVAARYNATRNPEAMYREPITVEDVVSSRMIADPLHKLDCCVISDGAGAVLLTTDNRARDTPHPPVRVLGVGEAIAALSMAQWEPFLELPAARSGAEAFGQAGLGPGDIDVVQLYDSYTSTVILQLEALGFCGRGEGGPFVEGGRLAWDGDLPCNTDGGGLSANHPGMRGVFLLIEAVAQLRGRSTAQVADARTALCNGVGAPTSTCGTVILGVD